MHLQNLSFDLFFPLIYLLKCFLCFFLDKDLTFAIIFNHRKNNHKNINQLQNSIPSCLENCCNSSEVKLSFLFSKITKLPYMGEEVL